MGWRQPSAQSPSEIKLYFSAPVQFCLNVLSNLETFSKETVLVFENVL